jgi:hypothetical protein
MIAWSLVYRIMPLDFVLREISWRCFADVREQVFLGAILGKAKRPRFAFIKTI